MQLSEHFTLDEFIFSETAHVHKIDNTPPKDVINNLKSTAAGLELIRLLLGFPIHVTSGFRCKELNHAVGGVSDSQHLTGEACDFVCPKFGSPMSIALALQNNLVMIGIDQLIMEGTWVHVSFTKQPRAQLLTLKNGKYVHGLV